VSIGDYVLTGGETPAMIIIDAVSRLVDGVISSDSIKDETFNNNLLEYPQYTRPAIYDGHAVPDVLISGHHAKIEEFKKYESIKRTYKYRPDLLEKANLSKEELKMLEAIKNEENN
jgi:tRNA (guanine37-N1)-methyltransferase